MSKIKLINDNFFAPRPRNEKVLLKLNRSVDLILTDPPYNIADSGKVTKAHGKVWSNADAWGDRFKDKFTPEEYDAFVRRFLRMSFCLLKPGGSLVVFMDDKYTGVMTRFAEHINLKQHERNKKEPPGFLHKKNIHFNKVNCVPKLRAFNYASAVEVAVWLMKPQIKGTKTKPSIFNYRKPTKGLRHPDGALNIKEYHNTYSSNTFFYNIGKKRTHHECEKYTTMLQPLIETHSNPGSLVLDPFFGGGNSALVCCELDRNYVGFDIDEEAYGNAQNLLAELMATGSCEKTSKAILEELRRRGRGEETEGSDA